MLVMSWQKYFKEPCSVPMSFRSTVSSGSIVSRARATFQAIPIVIRLKVISRAL